MQLTALLKTKSTPLQQLQLATARYKRSVRKAQRQSRKTRQNHFGSIGHQIQTASDAGDKKLVHKLANMATLPGLRESTRGQQLSQGEQVRKTDGTLTTTPEEYRARWIEHWTTLFNLDNYLPQERPLNKRILLTPFTMAELLEGQKKMDNDKAAGLDGYAIEVVKYLNCPAHRAALLDIYNTILRTGVVPYKWRNVVIVAVYKKKGSAQDCNSHRGISLISHWGKLLERMILHRLEPGLDDYTPHNQFGFKKGRGTVDAIFISKLIGTSVYNQRMADARCYVDLTKAYDKVNRELLWTIMRRLGIPECFVRVIISFHVGATAQAQLDDGLSATLPLNRGLKQGSVLSPILFNVFFGVLMNAFEEECHADPETKDLQLGAHIKYDLAEGLMKPSTLTILHQPTVKTLILYGILYADDFVIFCGSDKGLQHMMTLLEKVTTAFGMEIAEKKIEVLHNKFLVPTTQATTQCVPILPATLATVTPRRLHKNNPTSRREPKQRTAR